MRCYVGACVLSHLYAPFIINMCFVHKCNVCMDARTPCTQHKQLDVATTEMWQNECFYFSSLVFHFYFFPNKSSTKLNRSETEQRERETQQNIHMYSIFIRNTRRTNERTHTQNTKIYTTYNNCFLNCPIFAYDVLFFLFFTIL